MDSKKEKVNSGRDIRRAIGKRGEDIAASFLTRNGFTIMDRNWRCRYGEIDIIAMRDDFVHIIEVKTRRISQDGYPEESITDAKLARIAHLAELYLNQKHRAVEYQIDAILIDVLDIKKATLRYIPNFGW